MIIKKCERKEYKAMLVMLNKAFGCQDGWFERCSTTCTPYEEIASDELIACHYIAVKDGEVIGCVGAYPREVAIGGAFTVKGFGIGQVSCKEEERGRGVMTALMNAAIDSEVKNGAVLSYLWGNMPRYRHFGFKPAGERTEFNSIEIRRILHNADMNGFTANIPAHTDIGAMSALYSRYGAYVIRTEDHWKESLQRAGCECLYTSGNDGGAYLFAKTENKHIIEIQGDAAAVHKLLIYYARKHGLSELVVQYPYIRHNRDPVFNFLKDNTNWYTIQPMALAAVFGNNDEAERAGRIYGINENENLFWISEIDEV